MHTTFYSEKVNKESVGIPSRIWENKIKTNLIELCCEGWAGFMWLGTGSTTTDYEDLHFVNAIYQKIITFH